MTASEIRSELTGHDTRSETWAHAAEAGSYNEWERENFKLRPL